MFVIEVVLSVRISFAVFHMLTDEMENDQVVACIFCLDRIIAVKESFVESVGLCVATVELRFTQPLVVEEIASAEVEYLVIGLLYKLIGEECYMVARLMEQFGEKRLVAPTAFFIDGMHRHEILKYETGQIPCRDHICENVKMAASCPLRLMWRGMQGITV